MTFLDTLRIGLTANLDENFRTRPVFEKRGFVPVLRAANRKATVRKPRFSFPVAFQPVFRSLFVRKFSHTVKCLFNCIPDRNSTTYLLKMDDIDAELHWIRSQRRSDQIHQRVSFRNRGALRLPKVSIFFNKGLKIYQKSAQQNRRSQNVSDVQVQ